MKHYISHQKSMDKNSGWTIRGFGEYWEILSNGKPFCRCKTIKEANDFVKRNSEGTVEPMKSQILLPEIEEK